MMSWKKLNPNLNNRRKSTQRMYLKRQLFYQTGMNLKTYFGSVFRKQRKTYSKELSCKRKESITKTRSKMIILISKHILLLKIKESYLRNSFKMMKQPCLFTIEYSRQNLDHFLSKIHCSLMTKLNQNKTSKMSNLLK